MRPRSAGAPVISSMMDRGEIDDAGAEDVGQLEIWSGLQAAGAVGPAATLMRQSSRMTASLRPTSSTSLVISSL